MKTLIVSKYPMLYTKFQGHRPLGSEEEDILSFSENMVSLLQKHLFF